MANWTLNNSTDISDYITSRVANYNNAAEGQSLPPRQKGEIRVPLVQGIKIVNTQAVADGTAVTLSWQNISDSASIAVDHYNVYYSYPSQNATQKVGPYIAAASPATITIPSSIRVPVTFFIQTVLTNGMTSVLEKSLTVATVAQAAISESLVTGLTLTSNSPTSGNIAWTSCQINYNGVSYIISAGNTSAHEKFIYWTVGATTFTASNSFSPGLTVFLIATNTGGTADTAWNKVGTSAIQESNLSFSLLTGQQIQAPVTAALDTTGLTGNSATTVLSTTGDGTHIGGGLLTIGIQVGSTIRSGGTTSPKVDLNFSIDSQPTSSITVFDQSATTFKTAAQIIANDRTGTGNATGDTLTFQINIGFQSQLTVSVAFNTGPGVGMDGSKYNVSVLYCTKTS